MSEFDLSGRLAREFVMVSREPFLNYCLIKIHPTVGVSVAPMPLNVCFVLDKSGSMYSESRLEYVKRATRKALGMLRPTDQAGLVVFADKAATIFPMQPAGSPQNLQAMLDRLEAYNVGGGTAMAKGMELGLAELSRVMSPGALNRIALLTDGETSDEPRCRNIASEQFQKETGVSFSCFGVGSGWNDALLNEIDRRKNAKYIRTAQEAEQVFDDEFQLLTSMAFSNVRLTLTMMKGVTLRSIKRFYPEVTDVEYEIDGRTAWIYPRELAAGREEVFLAELVMEPREEGTYRAAHIGLTYDVPGEGRTGVSVTPVDLVMTYTSDRLKASTANQDVLHYVEQLTVANLTAKADEALRQGNVARATSLLTNARRVTELLGDTKRTTLLTQTLTELEKDGHVSDATRKTTYYGTRRTTLLTDDEK